MSSKKHEGSGYGHDLHLLIISTKLHLSYPTRSGGGEKNVHLGPTSLEPKFDSIPSTRTPPSCQEDLAKGQNKKQGIHTVPKVKYFLATSLKCKLEDVVSSRYIDVPIFNIAINWIPIF
jgi:hypothetical protein